MQYTLAYKNSTLSYRKSGHGNKALLLFHGFGQHHQAFAALTDTLAPHFTLYAFDLFFHGSSKWNEGEQPLEKEMWQEIMRKFLDEHHIEKFNVLGFSMGGKFALISLELFPRQVEQIILLAPDGIKTSFWYSLATYPLLLRKFFKSMILKPGRLHTVTAILNILRLVDSGLLRFAESQMATQEKRERVYYSWVVFRHLQVDIVKIAELINSHSIQLLMIVGKYDKIITARNMNHLLRHVPNHQLEIVDTGHNGVIDRSIPVLLQSIRQ
jgi:pimeloyl-ACP methyl ester carboxylesterase